MIESRHRIMFWAPTRRRHYAKLSQACLAEAGAIVSREWREGGGEGHWSANPEEVINRSRIAAKIEADYRDAVCKEETP